MPMRTAHRFIIATMALSFALGSPAGSQAVFLKHKTGQEQGRLDDSAKSAKICKKGKLLVAKMKPERAEKLFKLATLHDSTNTLTATASIGMMARTVA